MSNKPLVKYRQNQIKTKTEYFILFFFFSINKQIECWNVRVLGAT